MPRAARERPRGRQHQAIRAVEEPDAGQVAHRALDPVALGGVL